MAYVNLIDIIYPVGSIYVSVDKTGPQTLFGGSWTQITNKMLRGVSSSTASKQNLGSSSHNHIWGLKYASYYGILPTLLNADADNNMLQLINATSTTQEISTSDHSVNNSIGQGWKYVSKPVIVTKKAKTDSSSYLPEHMTCYMWYRTA